MDLDYWHKQADEPIYQDLAWSRPENRLQAGKLLIIGGNGHGFNVPAQSFTAAIKAGIGTARVLMPDSVAKQLSKFPKPNLEIEYTASTPSGSFALKSLSDFLSLSDWADGVLLAGNFGHNSETAILLEKFVAKHSGTLTLCEDAVDYFVKAPDSIAKRPSTCLVVTISQLQKLGLSLGFNKVFKFDTNILELVESLHEFSQQFAISIILKHLSVIYVAHNGQVSTTKQEADFDSWRIDTASKASVWWIQNSQKPFEAMTTSLLVN